MGNHGARECSNRLVDDVAGGLEELECANECDRTRDDPDDPRSASLSNREIIGKLELFTSRMISSLPYDSRQAAFVLIDVDRGADRDHRVQALDVLVAHAHAAMAH